MRRLFDYCTCIHGLMYYMIIFYFCHIVKAFVFMYIVELFNDRIQFRIRLICNVFFIIILFIIHYTFICIKRDDNIYILLFSYIYIHICIMYLHVVSVWMWCTIFEWYQCTYFDIIQFVYICSIVFCDQHYIYHIITFCYMTVYLIFLHKYFILYKRYIMGQHSLVSTRRAYQKGKRAPV